MNELHKSTCKYGNTNIIQKGQHCYMMTEINHAFVLVPFIYDITVNLSMKIWQSSFNCISLWIYLSLLLTHSSQWCCIVELWSCVQKPHQMIVSWADKAWSSEWMRMDVMVFQTKITGQHRNRLSSYKINVTTLFWVFYQVVPLGTHTYYAI
jgi:hypothetical protein